MCVCVCVCVGGQVGESVRKRERISVHVGWWKNFVSVPSGLEVAEECVCVCVRVSVCMLLCVLVCVCI